MEYRRCRMAEYLSKEEIKQWRSSLEKITLEDYAARLGKLVPDAKPTNDLVDMVFNENKKSSITPRRDIGNKLSKIAERAFERERQLSHTPFSFKTPKIEDTVVEPKAPSDGSNAEDAAKLRENVDIVLKKSLTDREQVVFDYLLEHKNTTVYAKDIAVLLNLPRDYIYKYIKNLRAKIEGYRIKNADKGGFILSV